MNDRNGEYVVSVTLNGDNPQTYTILTRTAYEAERMVRNLLNRRVDVRTFSIDLVREVQMAWDATTGRYSAPVVYVPEGFQRCIEVRHR
jgi:hypothetical protein